MTIRIIEQNTNERRNETRELFKNIQPYLDKGYSLHRAVLTVTGRKPTNTKNGWYRDLIDYSINKGYDYYGSKWNRIQGE